MTDIPIEDDVCQIQCIHLDSICRVKRAMPPDDQLFDLAALFKVLGDHTRIRILSALSESELCVCDLVDILGMNQSAVSHQLRVLRSSRIVRYRKEGKNVYYSLDDDHVHRLIGQGLEHVRENLP